MRQDTNEMAQEHVLRSTTFEYLLRAADACCTDEGTRREETYRDKEGENKKSRKQGTKARNRTQVVHSTKSSRLCYKADPATLSHHLHSYSCSRRQRYQVSLLPLSSVPTREKINEKRTKLPELWGYYSNSDSTNQSSRYLATSSAI